MGLLLRVLNFLMVAAAGSKGVRRSPWAGAGRVETKVIAVQMPYLPAVPKFPVKLRTDAAVGDRERTFVD